MPPRWASTVVSVYVRHNCTAATASAISTGDADTSHAKPTAARHSPLGPSQLESFQHSATRSSHATTNSTSQNSPVTMPHARSCAALSAVRAGASC